MSDEKRRGGVKPSGLKLTTSIKPLGTGEPRTTAIGASFQAKSVALSKKERENHTHIIGSTGTGKSKFIELLIRQDMTDRNCGLCLIDPHGSLYDEVVAYVAHSRPTLADRFILFNPAAEYEQIAGFNPIPADITHFDYTLSTLISACLKAWGQDNTDSTPRISRWLRNVFYPILAKRLTLLESAPLVDIYSKSERGALLANIENSLVVGDWMTFESLPLTQKQQQIEGAANRLQKFLSNEIIRNIIGQGSRALDFARILGEGKILLVNLSGGGKISYENAQLLGIMMVNEIFRVAKLRDPRDPKLKPFYFYIDEFGQFITRDIARALEECRKFKLFMILAHQHLAQLKNDDEYLYASVLTNCKNKVVFGGLSKEDADVMTDELVTGFVNLKSIKDEMYSTKHRYREETRTGRSYSTARTEGTSESETKTRSESYGETEGRTYGTSKGITDARGQSFTKSRNESRGESIGRGTSKGRSDGSTDTRGTSEGQSESDSRGWGRALNESETEGTNEGRSESDSRGTSRSRNQSETHGQSRSINRSDSRGVSEGTSESESKGTSRARNWADSTGTSESESESETHGRASTRGQSHTQSRMETEGRSENHGRSESTQWDRDRIRERGHTDGESRGFGSSHSTARGDSFSTSQSESESHGTTTGRTRGTNQSHSEGGSEGESESRSAGRNRSENRSHSEGRSEGISVNRTQGISEGTNQSHSKGRNYGTSKSQSKGTSVSQTGGHTTGRSYGQSQTHGKSHSDTFNESENFSENAQRGTSESEGLTSSRAESRQESESRSHSTTQTRGTSQGQMHGRSDSHTEGETVSEQTVFVPVEYQELSNRTFWTKDELHYMEMAAIKNQDTGEAFIKIGAGAPVRVKVEHVQSAPYSPRLTPKRVDAFRQKVFEKNSRYYTPLLEVRIEYEERQRRIFGVPLRFDETPMLSEGTIDIEARHIEEDEQDPFG